MARTANKTRTNGTNKEEYAASKANFAEIGVTGLSEFSGQIQQDFLKELRGKEAYKRYDEMRLNSAVIGAMLLAIEQAIRGVSWTFSSEQGEDDERVMLLEDAKGAMSTSWNDHITEALTMLPFGFSLFEIVYKRDERNRVLWRKFAIRGQDTVYRWLFDDTGGLSGFEQQRTDYTIVPIPIEKLLLYRTRVERNNPEGRSILRTAWVSYYFAKHWQQFEAIGGERDLAGLPVIKLPQGASTDTGASSDFSVAKKMVRNVRNDEQAGIVLPYGWEFELLSTAGQKQFDTDTIIKRYESRMLMSALAQFLMLGQDSVGTQALSEDMTDFFTMSVNATCDIIAETFTKYAIPRLLELNGYDAEGIVLEHTPAGDIDISMVADFLQKVGAMVTWSAEDEVWLRQLARLPDRDPEEIQAERDLKEQQAQEERQAFLQRVQQGKGSDEPQDDEQMNAMLMDYFLADAPDDDQRRKRERQMQKRIQEYFDGALPRILKAAKELKKGMPG